MKIQIGRKKLPELHENIFFLNKCLLKKKFPEFFQTFLNDQCTCRQIRETTNQVSMAKSYSYIPYTIFHGI